MLGSRLREGEKIGGGGRQEARSEMEEELKRKNTLSVAKLTSPFDQNKDLGRRRVSICPCQLFF